MRKICECCTWPYSPRGPCEYTCKGARPGGALGGRVLLLLHEGRLPSSQLGPSPV